MIKKIILASPRGFCAGVDRAIDVVLAALEIFGPPVYVKHAIVHNAHVVSDLEKKGAIFVESFDDIPAGSVLVFSAHGADPKIKEEAKKSGYRVIDATCPLVTKVHLEAQRYAKEGCYIIYVGHRGHPEPAGVFGEVNSGSIILIENEDEAVNLKVPQEEKLVYLTQTTLPIPETKKILEKLKERFPKIIAAPSSDICYSTTNRQEAVSALAKKCDLVLVCGSQTSSNSKSLRDVCLRLGTKAELVDDEKMVNEFWFEGVETLGITSGASAPEYLVERLVESVKGRNLQAEVETLEIMKENIKFPLPDDLVSMAKEIGKGTSFVEKHRTVSQTKI